MIGVECANSGERAATIGGSLQLEAEYVHRFAVLRVSDYTQEVESPLPQVAVRVDAPPRGAPFGSPGFRVSSVQVWPPSVDLKSPEPSPPLHRIHGCAGRLHDPAHSHTSAERMVLVEGQLTVTYKGAAAARLTPGVYAYGPASLPHEAKCAGRKPCTLFIAFKGPVDANAYVGSLK